MCNATYQSDTLSCRLLTIQPNSLDKHLVVLVFLPNNSVKMAFLLSFGHCRIRKFSFCGASKVIFSHLFTSRKSSYDCMSFWVMGDTSRLPESMENGATYPSRTHVRLSLLPPIGSKVASFGAIHTSFKDKIVLFLLLKVRKSPVSVAFQYPEYCFRNITNHLKRQNL